MAAVSQNNGKRALRNTTLVAVTTLDYKMTRVALNRCLKFADFANIVIFTDDNIEFALNLRPGDTPVKSVYIPKHVSWEDVSVTGLVTVSENYKLFADYCLAVQWDGFIVNPGAWDNAFFDYDFIGAPWPDNVVGNNGFCLCSLSWYRAVLELNLEPTREACHPADAVLCRDSTDGRFKRQEMVEQGMRIAPPVVARKFSVENDCYRGSFGFHGTDVLRQVYQLGLITD